MAPSKDCNKAFADSYMLLNHEDAHFFDLVSLLFSRRVGKRKFVESHHAEALEESFGNRWLIFMSIIGQKLLQLVADPLRKFGNFVEKLMNLLLLNGGFFMLILNFLKGKTIWPEPKSKDYISCIGNLDARIKLDDKIKHTHSKYYVALSMLAAKASYENEAFIKYTVENHWKMEFVGFYDCWNEYQNNVTTQVMIALDRFQGHDTYVVAFRGTEPFNADDWCSDIDISWYGIPGVGKMHGGFMKALGLHKNHGWPKEINRDPSRPPLAYYVVRDILRKRLSENENAKFIVTGHSLGGALAILFGTILCLHEETLLLKRLEGIYTFGQPRVGDEGYARYMKQKMKEHSIKYFRFVYNNDIVPRLPYDDKEMLFKHFGTCLFFNWLYKLEVLEEQPNKNYFSPWCVIPMAVQAMLEIIRSFFIVYITGPNYKEGWLLFAFRTIGIIIPGLPAHGPADYLNSTLLGALDKLKSE